MFIFAPCTIMLRGEMPEWSIGAVSKTVVPHRGTGGSNPPLSAKLKKTTRQRRVVFVFMRDWAGLDRAKSCFTHRSSPKS